jgi:hypothetical protein
VSTRPATTDVVGAPSLPPLEDSFLGLAAAAVSSATGTNVLFAFLALFLLAIPRMGRWLRPLRNLGWSPAYVSLRERPG